MKLLLLILSILLVVIYLALSYVSDTAFGTVAYAVCACIWLGVATMQWEL